MCVLMMLLLYWEAESVSKLSMQRLVMKRKIIDRRIEAFGVWNVTRLAQVCSLVEVRSSLSTSRLPILASTREMQI